MYTVFSVALGFSILIFLYVLLSFEIMHRTAAALLTAAIVVGLNIALRYTTFTDLFEGVDLDTILLLMSMMMIVGVLSRSRVFTYLSHVILTKMFRHPFTLLAVMSGITALISAFIDNVTTVLLIAPIVIEICRELRIDPRPMLLSIVFASNIGGTATLIGDPPNIIIGSVAKLGFMDFIRNLTPIVAIDFLIFLGLLYLLFKPWIKVYRLRVAELENLRVSMPSIDRALFRRVMVALLIAISMFFLEDLLGYPPAIPAMIGAGILMLLTRKMVSIEAVLSDVDWSTLVFFIAMFIVIRGVERLGLMDFIAGLILGASRSIDVLMMLILWVAAFTSAFVDNIPFVMAMVPVIKAIASSLSLDPTPLYWSLSLGGCLGGNGTLIGASANIVVAGIADKHGFHIPFKYFTKYGMPVMVVTVGCSAVYLLLRYP